MKRYDYVQVNACYTTDHEMERADDGEWVRYEDVEPVLQACQLAKRACQDNLSKYAYKNEPVLLEAFKACAAALRPHWGPHDDDCESELTSHGYTPCRCDERAGSGVPR